MDWKGWENKNVSIELKSGREYFGKVVDVDISGGGLIWITIINEKGHRIPFVNSEIDNIKEEVPDKQKLKEEKE